MQPSSSASLRAAVERLDSLPPDQLGEVAGELASVADLLGSETTLRRALSDPSQPGANRATLARRLLGGRISERTVDVVCDVVEQRWARPLDLVAGLESLAAEARYGQAENQGVLDDVEDEVFRFGRVVAREPRLQQALTDDSLPAERKRGLLERLLDGKANAITISLLERVATARSGDSLERRLEVLAAMASRRRQVLLASVRTARPLDPDLADRLRRALVGVYEREISLQVDVDPRLIGGLVVQVGDEVVDGSVIRRLATARQGLTA